MTRTVAILVFPEAETLDYAGPYEVFGVASEIAGKPLFRPLLVARERGTVRGCHGFTIEAAAGHADVPAPEILLVPGGFGTRALVHDVATIDWLRAAASRAQLVLSVCTGAFLLAKAGLLDGLPCTTHYAHTARLRREFPHLDVRDGVRYVDNGRVLTSAGITAGIDMALHVVARLHGEEHARATAREMEFTWTPC